MVETLFGIEIVESDDGDVTEEGVELYNAKFKLVSLQKYNGKTISINLNWDIVVYDDKGKVLEELNLIENEEFKGKLLDKTNKIKL